MTEIIPPSDPSDEQRGWAVIRLKEGKDLELEDGLRRIESRLTLLAIDVRILLESLERE